MKTAVVAAVAVAAASLAFWLWTPDLPRATLEARYLASAGDMVAVGGTRLHLRDSGPRGAPAVVLLHGFGASLHTWEPWTQALEARHRVVRFDLPGAGLSPPDSTGDYSDARVMALLIEVLDRLGIERADIVGHSIGGRIAARFAAAHPGRVDKLVLVAPDGFASSAFEYGKAPEVPAVLALMRYVLPRPLLRMTLAPAYADASKLTDATTGRYHDLMRGPGVRDAMLARLRQTVLDDPRPRLRSIGAPTLLIWGERDAMIPFANSADYIQALPNATLVPLPGVGHVPQEEAPERSLAALLAFLG